MDEPEMDLEFCYYSGSDEADEEANEPPRMLISDFVKSIRNELENNIELKSEPFDDSFSNDINCKPSKASDDDDFSDDNSISSKDDSNDEPTMMKRFSVGSRKRAIVSIRSFRKNIRRLSRHKSTQNGKKKKQKEEVKETKEKNGRESAIQGLNREEKQVKRKEVDVLDSDKNEEKSHEVRSNDEVKQQGEKEIKHESGELNEDGIKALNCETKPDKVNGIEINSTAKKDVIAGKKIEIEFIDLSDDSDDDEQEKGLDSTNKSKMQNDIEGDKNAENQKENDTKDTIRSLRQRKRSGTKMVADGNKQHKPNEIEDKDQNAVPSQRPMTRQAKMNASSKIYIQSEPLQMSPTRTSPRNASKKPRTSAVAEKLTFEPFGDPITAYKDSLGNLYREWIAYTNSMYLKCQGDGCSVTLIYDKRNERVRQIGSHSNHPSKDNEIRLIELRNLLRRKLFDETLNFSEIHDIYRDCLAEFKGIVLPQSHYRNTIEALRHYRKKSQQSGDQKANGVAKHQINASKDGQSTESNGLKKDHKAISKSIEIMKTPKSKAKLPRNSGTSFEPLAGSEALFKDDMCNIYRKQSANSTYMYLQCQGDNCPVNAIYNMVDKTVRFIGKHSNHPSDPNDVLLIEFNTLMRSRALDPRYLHVKSLDLYNKCIAEFKEMKLPDNHRIQSMMAINYCRKRLRENRKKDPNATFSLNNGLKMHAIIPKAAKIGRQTPSQLQKILLVESPKSVPKDEPKKPCTCNCGCHDAHAAVETPAKDVKISPKSSGAKKTAKIPTKTPTKGLRSHKQQPTISSLFSKTNKNRLARLSD